VLASGLYVVSAFVRPPPNTHPPFPLSLLRPFTDPERGPHGWVRSVVGEPLGCGDVYARFTRDLVSGFTISSLHPTCSGFTAGLI